MKSYIPGIFAFIAGAVLFAANVPAKEDNVVLDAYVKVSQALAADDLNGAESAATDLASKAKSGGNEALASQASSWRKATRSIRRVLTSKWRAVKPASSLRENPDIA